MSQAGDDESTMKSTVSPMPRDHDRPLYWKKRGKIPSYMCACEHMCVCHAPAMAEAPAAPEAPAPTCHLSTVHPLGAPQHLAGGLKTLGSFSRGQGREPCPWLAVLCLHASRDGNLTISKASRQGFLACGPRWR